MNSRRLHWGVLALLLLSWLVRPSFAAESVDAPGSTMVSADSKGSALDLETALSEALQHSPDYLLARATASEKDWGQMEAWSDFLPHVSLGGTRYFESTYQTLPVNMGGLALTFPEVYPYESYGLNASWTLFNGFSGINSLRASSAQSHAADLEQDWALFKLKQSVRLKFYQALAVGELSALADVNVQTLRDHLRIVNDLLSNGRATRFDLLRVEVELDNALNDQLDAKNQVDVARRALAVAMGEEGDSRSLNGSLPEPASAPIAALAPEDKPDIKALRLKADAARAASEATGGNWLPKVSVIGAYQWYDNGYNSQNQMDPSDTAAHGTDYDLGLEASWEIFNGGGDLARQMQAERRADEAVQSARAAELKASQDRYYWSRRLAYSTERYQAELADVDKAKESVRLATDGLEAGTRTTTEVLDAELESFRAQAAVVSAKLDAAEALINLELALGTGDLP